MNIFQIISEIEKVDPEVYDRLDSRRSIFKHMSGLGQKLTAAAVPLAMGAIFNKVYAQTPMGAGVNDVLNFALSLEYLERYFYDRGQTTAALQAGFSTNNQAALNLIRTDEANHVTFLRSVLGAAAIADPTAATFDFTGGKGSGAGPLATVFTSTGTYLAVAQSLEDTGVRAYKGGAPLLIGAANRTVLTAALNIHSVEARHASRLRTMRRALATSTTPAQSAQSGSLNNSPKSWISGNDNGGAAPGITDAIYNAGNNMNAPAMVTFDAESNVTQGGVNLQNALASLNFPASAFSEAFDEALDVTTVKAIARTFVVNGSNFLA
ncbi:MAG TPA: ferritin-like domain-containing protein [Hymenobacter sp.]|jgi:hypothetical protein|uniref:ferritin-like domain-containing protein n=1 Tax=Hymenobacter sp. TaxID=1898978 RepID=UPI002ED93308